MSKWYILIVVSLTLLFFLIGFYYLALPYSSPEPIEKWGYNYKMVVYPATYTWPGEVRKFRGYIKYFLPDNFTHASEDLVLSVYYRHNNTRKVILKRHIEYNKTMRVDFEYIGEAHPDCELVVGIYNSTLREEVRGNETIGWVVTLYGEDYEFSIKPYKCNLYDRLVNGLVLSPIGLLLGLLIVLLITMITGERSEGKKRAISRIPYRGGT